jgi:copper homeostasis protein
MNYENCLLLFIFAKNSIKTMSRIIEICANSAQSCLEAELGGAKRVELCAGIPEGGTTPSYGEIYTARALTSWIDINVIIRPRGGDFLYTQSEVRSMMADIALCKQIKVHGVVFGCLKRDGHFDLPLMKQLIDAARPLSITCHRAFDVCNDPFKALEELIQLGCDRILTSGQKPNAVEGIPMIRELVKRAKGRIIIMPGCGVRPNNIAMIEKETGAKEFHSSARSILQSQMEYRNEEVLMGSSAVTSGYETAQTDRQIVRQLL